MAMQFEYDDKGTTFYYFVLSFFAMILLPCTYYFWPDHRRKDSTKDNPRQCFCRPCLSKKTALNQKEPRRKTVKKLLRAVIVVLWALLIAGVVKVAQFEKEYSEYNPYDVLKLEQGASDGEIKRAYRELSKKLHPDRGGDPTEFMKVAKAYQALTDEEAKKNWDEYGNPDGPTATQFGIALPSWIVDKKNSMWVLGAYILAIIIIMPIAVGTWWYRSIQYSADEVLMDTDQVYGYFFHRTPNMSVKRIIMILAASLEFEKGHNAEVQERPSDNIDLPQLMRQLPHLNEKNKEVPLCYLYSVKARALLHAHLGRVTLPPDTLQKDLELILKKCPYLLKEMMNVVSQLMVLGKQGRVALPPRLATVENLIKVMQIVIQGLWECESPFLMLPHITQENLKHFTSKKRRIKTIREFVGMKNNDRRSLLRTLTEEQYQDVINVCWSFPHLDVDVKVKVIDDEDVHLVTAGSIVTAVVQLKRSSLGKFFEDDTSPELVAEDEKLEEADVPESSQPSKPVWQRKQKKGKGAKKPVKKQQAKKPSKKKEEAKKDEALEEEDEKNKKVGQKKASHQSKEKESADGNDADSEHDGADGVEEVNEDEEVSPASDDNVVEGESEEDEKGGLAEDEWSALKDDDLIQPEKLLEVKSRESRPAHCPYFPLEKQEYWWAYIVARKTNTLASAPLQITDLKEEQEVQLKFTAPDKTGTYQYQVWVRSDSYIDFDVYKNFKVDVSEAKEFDPGAHWDYTSDEEGKEESGESVYETEEENEAEDKE